MRPDTHLGRAGRRRCGWPARCCWRARSWPSRGWAAFTWPVTRPTPTAVRTLRARKGRPAKPLAVMMATLDEVRRHCHVSDEEEALLTSQQCPIVLLRWRDDSTVVREVAPSNLYLGVMLPYTPLHHILLRDVGRPLVMTSGNLSEEPIAQDNDEARQPPGPPGRRLPDAQPRHLCPLRRLGLVRRPILDAPSSEFPVCPAHPPLAGLCALSGPAALPDRADPGRRRRAEEHLLPDPRRFCLSQPAHRRHGEPGDPGAL